MSIGSSCISCSDTIQKEQFQESVLPGHICSHSNLAQVPVSTTDWQLSPLQAPHEALQHYRQCISMKSAFL